MVWTLFFAIMLFVISLISIILENLAFAIPFLSILPTLINSSSGPLSVMCLIAAIGVLWKYKDNKASAVLPITFYSLDLISINKLYLNATWSAFATWVLATFTVVKAWNWPIIVITTVCMAVAAAILICGIHIWKRERAKKKTQIGSAPIAQHAMTESKPSPHTAQSGSNKEANLPPPTEAPSDATTPMCVEPPANNVASTPSSLTYSLACIVLIIPAVAFIQYVFYRTLPLDLTVPKFVNDTLDTLLYLSTICIGLVMVLFLLIAKKQAPLSGKAGPLRRPAVLALILEILLFILFFFNADFVDPQFLNSFLNFVTNNVLAALIIVPIVLFVILDVGISLFINVFWGDISNRSQGWQREAHEKLNEIQRRIVIFVLNIFLGILNLFLFIPDFFNEIGDLLLSEEKLFPSFDRKNNESRQSPDPPKPTVD